MFEGVRVTENWPPMGELDCKEKNINEVTFHSSLSDVLPALWQRGEGNPKSLIASGLLAY